MSGADATQHLFMRLNQEEYYVEERTEESTLKFYPTVAHIHNCLVTSTYM